MTLNKDKKFLVVGLGLMGGSVAYRLSMNGYEVGAIALNQADIDYAIEKKIISSGQVEVNKEYLSHFDVIIFALYPHDFVNWMKKYHSLIKAGTLVTDVTGVKGKVVDEIQNVLKDDDVEFIAAHPMAGREVSGVKNATPDLFKGANYIITPTENNTEDAINFLKELGKEFEFKYISTLSVEQHDEMIGFVSQLTHCIAISLMTCKYDTKDLVKYTGDSFRDLTRIAKINEEMWCELFLYNKEQLLKEIDCFMNQLQKLRNAINDENEDEIKDIMRLSTENRAYFDKGGK